MNPDERFDQQIRAALEWHVERDARRAPSLAQSADAVARRLGPQGARPGSVIGARQDPFGGLQIALLLMLMALLAIGIAVGSDLALPTRPAVAPFGLAANGQLAYGRDGDIWVGDLRSGATELFVGGPAYERRPVWSPDGTRLVFLRGERLFAVDAEGGEPVQLTPDLLIDLGVIRWSPDGQLIAVEHTIDGVSGVSIIRTDGGGVQRLDIGIEASFPDWRPPDGRQLLLRSVAPTGVPDLYTVDPDGSGLRSLGLASPRLDGGGTDLLGSSWSPDGRQILYGGLEFKDPVSGVNRYRTHIVNADGTGDRLIDAPPDRSDVWPVWSPDGRFIHFERVAGDYLGPDAEVWLAIARADGTGLVEIGEVSDPSGLGAIWSPDGTRLLAHYATGGGTFEVDPVAGTARVLAWTTGGDLSWQRR